MLTEIELKKVQDVEKFIVNNITREPVRINISFQHRNFKENKGFVSIELSQEIMDELLISIRKTLQETRNN